MKSCVQHPKVTICFPMYQVLMDFELGIGIYIHVKYAYMYIHIYGVGIYTCKIEIYIYFIFTCNNLSSETLIIHLSLLWNQ